MSIMIQIFSFYKTWQLIFWLCQEQFNVLPYTHKCVQTPPTKAVFNTKSNIADRHIYLIRRCKKEDWKPDDWESLEVRKGFKNPQKPYYALLSYIPPFESANVSTTDEYQKYHNY